MTPGMQIDFSKVEDSFEAIPEGLYECIVEDAQVRESKSSDNPYISFEMKILDEEFEDRRIWIGASLSKKALWGLKGILVALGAIEEDDVLDLEWDEEVDMTPREGPQVTNPEVIGLPCAVQTVNSVYNNKERQDMWNSTVLPTGSEGLESGTEEEETEEKPVAKRKGAAAKKGAKKAGAAKKRKLR